MTSRFFVPPEQIHQDHFVIVGSEARHAALVLRKKVGDTIDLFDGKDLSYQGRIEIISHDRVEGAVLSQGKSDTLLSIELTLYQALIKGPKWDWLVEKACEIGVTKLVPILSARTIVKPSKSEANERWQRIALAASKQSGRSRVMDIGGVLPFDEALPAAGSEGLWLIPWEKESKQTIRQAVLSSPAVAGRGSMDPRQGHSGMTSHVSLFIGPEGGWEPQEVDLAVRHGVIPVRLGPTLLRSDTAGIVASSLVLSECGVYS